MPVARIAEGAALLSEPFAGHGEGVPRPLGDHLALALGDHRHDAHHGFVSVRQIGGENRSPVANKQVAFGPALLMATTALGRAQEALDLRR